ncbi:MULTISPECIES: four helix bundle protein [unclassified Endozoicomonas]|uniref:four helix bundle protein n=1 Tax=unclassified Endozoicomonas TaxID=2644528 RepID=UPI003BB7A35F
MNFERLLVWQEAVELCTKVILSFKHCRDFGFKDQVTRSSLSVPSNIAEGMSRRGDKEKIQFLCISLGSCAPCVSRVKNPTNHCRTSRLPANP